MSDPARYDAIVLGAGQAGSALAIALAAAGRNVAMVERAHVGGTCVNTGCTPSKTMYACARIAHLARRAVDYGVRAGAVTVDMPRVRSRVRQVVHRFRESGTESLRDTPGISLVFGDARFCDARLVQVSTREGEHIELSSPLIFINTGSRPLVPDLEGLDKVPYLDSAAVMDLDTVPEHLVVLGGSTVGVEFAQMFRRFGSRVSIVERSPQLLPEEDRDVAATMAEILRQDGIAVFLETSTTEVRRLNEGRLALALRPPNAERILTGTHLLMAVGRRPNTESLQLAKAGVATDERGYVRVNERLETTAPGIYALGDVCGSPPFTHFSYDDFRIVRNNLLRNDHASTASRTVCYTVFTDPQLGRVGLTESEARKRYGSLCVAKLPLTRVARAIESDETRGFIKAIADASSGQILGAAAFGMEGGELMSMLQIAMIGKIPYPVLRETVFAHPTLAESLNNLFLSLEAQTCEASGESTPTKPDKRSLSHESAIFPDRHSDAAPEGARTH